MQDLPATHRFSDRVENYVRYRPSYPEGVLKILKEETALRPQSEIADIGSGTGISSELFLRNGNLVFSVEPNPAMRQAAEQQLATYPNFRSIEGTAEATTLPDQSVDYVICAQAFHWFNQIQAKQEFKRILKPGGYLILMWNTRRINTTPFLQAYESLLLRYSTDYRQVHHRNIAIEDLQRFFNRSINRKALYNEQLFNFTELKGRLLSSSYTPNDQHPSFQPMLNDLRHIFAQYQSNNQVRFEYDTEIYFGRLG